MAFARRNRNKDGFTLVELMVAMAIFSMVLGATAQALVSYYAALDTQDQRNTATRHCTTVLSQMREARAAAATFPGGITTLWPNTGVVAGVSSLPGEVVQVTYKSATADPLEVTVTSQFRDLRGRTLTVRVSTILTGV